MRNYIKEMTEGDFVKDPTDKQMQLASTIADALGIELPAETTGQSLFLFVRDNMPWFEERRRVDRHNAMVYAVAYESEATDEGPDPGNDRMFMDALGINPLTGGFEDDC